MYIGEFLGFCPLEVLCCKYFTISGKKAISEYSCHACPPVQSDGSHLGCKLESPGGAVEHAGAWLRQGEKAQKKPNLLLLCLDMQPPECLQRNQNRDRKRRIPSTVKPFVRNDYNYFHCRQISLYKVASRILAHWINVLKPKADG